MSFRTVTDYFSIANSSAGIEITSSDENKSSTFIQARDEKGDIVAQEELNSECAPSCNYVISKAVSLANKKIGTPITSGTNTYTITGISINTSAGAPPSIQVSGESVPSGQAEDNCYYDIPEVSINYCHHAQLLFGCVTQTLAQLANSSLYLTQANYNVSGSLTKATKDGETIAYDVTDGKIEAQLTFVCTTNSGIVSTPTLTKGTGWEFSSPLTKSEPDADYVQFTCTLTKNLTHHQATTQAGG